MQKKLIALAIAGLSGAAFAQSNVTIYGAMDATYDNVKADSSSNTYAGTGNNGLKELQSRGRTSMNSSYIGFKGVEAIGNGYAVAFQIETGVGGNAGGTNTVAASTYGWANRDTYVGLATPFGTFAAGTVTGPARAMGNEWDVNAGAAGLGANTALLGKIAGGAGASYADTRFANTIAYISPNLNGFSGVLAYVPNQNRGTDVNTGTTPNANTDAWTLGLNYANGPFKVAYAYTEIKDDDDSANVAGSGLGVVTGLNSSAWKGAAGLNPLQTAVLGSTNTYISKYEDNRLAFKWDFGQGTIGLLWDEVKADVLGVTGAALGASKEAKSETWYIPFTYVIGNGKIIAQYGKTTAKGELYDTLGVDKNDFGAKHYEIGYEYSLSKRTTLKALYSEIKNDDGATYDFNTAVTNQGSSSISSGAVAPGSKVQGISVGLRHSF